MIVGVDASNIKSGGGLNHLLQNIYHVDKIDVKIEKIFIWAPSNTLIKIKNNNKVYKKTNNWINRSFLPRVFWNYFILPKELTKQKCNVLFSPGATMVNTKLPIVSMVQNELPFSWDNMKKFGISLFFCKLFLLRIYQIRCFKKSNGLIFLSENSKNSLRKFIDLSKKKIAIIPHGVDKSFYKKPKIQKPITSYSKKNPFRLLYVSDLWPYKNHLNVIKAVATIRMEGFPVTIDLVGDYYKPYYEIIKKEILKLDFNNQFIFFKGKSNEVKFFYHNSDGFIFASSCETFGQILTEAMMSGLPILCSDKSAMPEIIRNSALYFNPENENNLIVNLKKFLISERLRTKICFGVNKKAEKWTWSNNARKTFSFINENCKYEHY